jgi:hypothetical protein
VLGTTTNAAGTATATPPAKDRLMSTTTPGATSGSGSGSTREADLGGHAPTTTVDPNTIYDDKYIPTTAVWIVGVILGFSVGSLLGVGMLQCLKPRGIAQWKKVGKACMDFGRIVCSCGKGRGYVRLGREQGELHHAENPAFQPHYDLPSDDAASDVEMATGRRDSRPDAAAAEGVDGADGEGGMEGMHEH